MPAAATSAVTALLALASCCAGLASAQGVPPSYTANLTFGSPVAGLVQQCGAPWSCPAYYVYAAPVGFPFRVLVTQYSGAGAVDLFVGNGSFPFPGPAGSSYSSVTSAPVQIVDVPGSAVACAPPPNASVALTVCPFYIAVAPYNTGFLLFSVVVTTASGGGGVQTLTDGRPQSNLATAGSQNLYNFSVASSSTFSALAISTSGFYGVGNVFVTVNGVPPGPPGPGNSLYSATGGNGDNFLYVPFADAAFASACPFGSAACSVAIAVGSSAVDYLYEITATSSAGVATLANGVPLQGMVTQNAYAYFNFTPPFRGSFTITVQAFSGDPDLYVSATVARPTTSVYTWVSATDLDEVVQILPSDPNYLPPPATYAIGVFGYSGNVSFQITAQMDAAGGYTAALVDGVPTVGIAPAHSFAYYSFSMAARYPVGRPFPSLDIASLPQQGTTDVYVSNMTTTDAAGNTVPVFPQPICLFYGNAGTCYVYGVNASTYTWSSAGQGSSNFVSIPASQLYPGENFTIGVFSTSNSGPTGPPPPSIFSVVASTGAAVMQIPLGVQVPGSVKPAQYKNYRVTTTAWGMDIVVQGTRKSSGSFDIYASEGASPTNGNSTVRALAWPVLVVAGGRCHISAGLGRRKCSPS